MHTLVVGVEDAEASFECDFRRKSLLDTPANYASSIQMILGGDADRNNMKEVKVIGKLDREKRMSCAHIPMPPPPTLRCSVKVDH